MDLLECMDLNGFREPVDYLEDNEVTEKDIKQFIPFADWQGAGMLCINTTKGNARKIALPGAC